MELQAGNTPDPVTKEALAESQSRIRSIALIHKQLYRRQDLAGVVFKSFATELATQVSTALKRTGQTVVTTVDAPEIVLDMDTSIPLGLLLNELLTNSYKHAFVDGTEGYIYMTLRSVTANQFELTYADNGIGLPANFVLSQSNSMGLRLVRRLARQISGEAVYDHAGKQFSIRFKNSATRKEDT